MFLIVGLGNPGLKYKKTRHNLGFRTLDYFRKENNFPRFKLAKKFKAEISESAMAGQKIMLIKPQAFMNNSGSAVKRIFNFYSSSRPVILSPAKGGAKNPLLIVVHDDLDIPLGEIKISQNKSAGGHKGAQSIIDQLGSQDFIRLRLGIGQKEMSNVKCNMLKPNVKCKSLEKFVLGKFSSAEKPLVEQAIKKAGQELNKLLAQQID